MRIIRIICLVMVVGFSMILAAEEPGSYFDQWPGLTAGEFTVGFKVEHLYDYSRTFKKPVSFDGKPVTGETARPLQIAIWYPALREDSAGLMEYVDYRMLLLSHFDFGNAGAMTREGAITHMVQDAPKDGMDPRVIEELVQTATLAVRDAPPIEGHFPLLIYAPGFETSSIDNFVLCEYLASHGYVVAATPSFGPTGPTMTDNFRGLEAKTRDHEFVMAHMRDFPGVDFDRVGALGWSNGGLSVVYLALRNPRVRAIASLDGSMAYPGSQAMIDDLPDYSLSDLQIPWIYATQSLTGSKNLDFWEETVYSDSFLLYLDNLQHYDFSSEFILINFRTGKDGVSRDPDKISRDYITLCKYLVAFFDGYLKQDLEAMAFLNSDPKQAGTDDTVSKIKRKTGKPAPPSEDEFFGMIRGGQFKQALTLFDSIRESDPDRTLFSEDRMLRLAGFVLGRGDTEKATELYRLNLRAHPDSWRSHNILGDIYTKTGNPAEAEKHYTESLRINPDNNTAGAMLNSGPPDESLTDPEYIGKFAGVFAQGGISIRMEVRDGKLYGIVGAQAYEMTPVRENYFKDAQNPGFYAEFVTDGDGNVTTLIAHQPHGDMTLSRKEQD